MLALRRARRRDQAAAHVLRTMQVALNEGFKGGELVFATGEGFLVPPRPAGTATVHESQQVHGVAKLALGRRPLRPPLVPHRRRTKRRSGGFFERAHRPRPRRARLLRGDAPVAFGGFGSGPAVGRCRLRRLTPRRNGRLADPCCRRAEPPSRGRTHMLNPLPASVCKHAGWSALGRSSITIRAPTRWSVMHA